MTILEHLEELRVRIIKTLIAFGVAFVVAWFLYNPILSFLTLPIAHLKDSAPVIRQGHRLVVTAVTDPFFIRVKVVSFAALALASPVALWQAWRFVAPGLYAKEKKYAIPFVASALVLFAAGVGLALWTLPLALRVLAGFSGSHLQILPTASEYFSFVLLLIVGFGVAFELPLVLTAFSLVGVLSSKRLRAWRRPAWVVLLVIAGALTPSQDPLTQFLLAIPLAILYEITIWVTRLLRR